MRADGRGTVWMAMRGLRPAGRRKREICCGLALLCSLWIYLPSWAEAVNDAKEDPGQLYRSALELFRQREYEAAVPLLVKSVDSYPLLADHASYYLAESLFQLKQWEKAREQFERLIKGYPDSVWIQLAALRW